MAPDELVSILGVGPGGVTPLAVAHPTGTDVVLLLDTKIRDVPAVYVHPMQNTASLPMTSAELEAFLASLNRTPVWVDLEAEPKIDRDNPPDLKHIADAARPIVGLDGEEPSQVGAKSTSQISTKQPNGEQAEKSKAVKAESKCQKQNPSRDKSDSREALDVAIVSQRIIAMLTSEGAGSAEGEALRKVRADVVTELNALRNAAYSTGFKAAKGAIASSLYNYT